MKINQLNTGEEAVTAHLILVVILLLSCCYLVVAGVSRYSDYTTEQGEARATLLNGQS